MRRFGRFADGEDDFAELFFARSHEGALRGTGGDADGRVDHSNRRGGFLQLFRRVLEFDFQPTGANALDAHRLGVRQDFVLNRQAKLRLGRFAGRNGVEEEITGAFGVVLTTGEANRVPGDLPADDDLLDRRFRDVGANANDLLKRDLRHAGLKRRDAFKKIRRVREKVVRTFFIGQLGEVDFFDLEVQ